MKFESALHLQMEIFNNVFEYQRLPASLSDATADVPTFVDPRLVEPTFLGGRAALAEHTPLQDIALGVAIPHEKPDDGDEVSLAVLLQDEALANSGLVDSIREIAHGEVEVIFIGRQQPLWTQNRHRPLLMGCSTSPSTVGYAGTLGFFVRDIKEGNVGFVSNNHVLADVNRLSLGTPIMQPGALDGGNPVKDLIGNLTRYVPIHLGGLPNTVDAAFATLDPDVKFNHADIFGNGNPPPIAAKLNPGANGPILPGLDVLKTGRTTRCTTGRILAVNVNNYMVTMYPGTVARFDGQIVFDAGPNGNTQFSAPGDSGSLIVSGQNGMPVALLFAGSNAGGHGNLGITAGNPISSVLAQLGVTWI